MTSLSLNEMIVTISLRTLLSHWVGKGGGTNLSLAFLLLIPFIHSFTYSFIYFVIHLVNFVGQFVSARHCARYCGFKSKSDNSFCFVQGTVEERQVSRQ